MKTALVVLLILLVLATGLPMPAGIAAMPACQNCGPASLVAACTLATVAAVLMVLCIRLHRRRDTIPVSLHSFLLERPPRLV